MLYNKRIFRRCFCYKGRQAWRNIKALPVYLRQLQFLMKHGYDEYALWETFDWFIVTVKEILTHYKEENTGTPLLACDDEGDLLSDEAFEKSEAEWNSALDEMLSLLDRMGEDNDEDEQNAAKDRFFVLFSRYFYKLWD